MERVASGDRDVLEATGSSAGQRTGKPRGGFGHGNPSLGVSKAQRPKALGIKCTPEVCIHEEEKATTGLERGGSSRGSPTAAGFGPFLTTLPERLREAGRRAGSSDRRSLFLPLAGS